MYCGERQNPDNSVMYCPNCQIPLPSEDWPAVSHLWNCGFTFAQAVAVFQHQLSSVETLQKTVNGLHQVSANSAVSRSVRQSLPVSRAMGTKNFLSPANALEAIPATRRA
jgi:hypothetical protein